MKKPINEAIKPTLKDPISDQSKGYEKQFTKSMATHAPTINLNEVDVMLSEVEQSLKKKIFSLPKMEALTFSDPKLTAVYNKMSEDGEEKYGYHYNETIQNMIFNDYVLNSPKYLQKYKMAIPKKKKRRDKSGINQAKKAGEEKMKKNPVFKPKEPDLAMAAESVNENDEAMTKVLFLVNETDPENQDVFAYFPEEVHNGVYRTAYSHIGQHSACHPEYAAESREATPEEYQDLKAELENQVGYNLEVLNGMQETTGAGASGAFAPALNFKQVEESSTTGSVGGATGEPSGAYYTNAAWGAGDLMKGKKAKVMSKPIWKGGTIIQESNYLIESTGFEKYIQELDGESDADFIQRHGSNTYGNVDNMNPENQKLIKQDIQNGKLNSNANIKGSIGLQEEETGMLTTVEQVKALGRKLTKADIPNLAGEALYRLAIQLAGQLLPFGWDDLPDVNSMWSYINKEGGMTYEQLWKAVKEAVEERISEEGMSLDDLMEDKLNEKAKSKSQQQLFGIAHAAQKGEIPMNKLGGAAKKIAKTVSADDVEDFASTKHKNLPDHVDEEVEMGSQVFNKGDKVFDKLHNSYGIVLDNYGDPINGDRGDIRLDSDGNVPIYQHDDKWNVVGYNLTKVENGIEETELTIIGQNNSTMANKAQPEGDQGGSVPTGTQQTGGLNEALSKERRMEMIRKIQDVSANTSTGMPTSSHLNTLSDDELIKKHDMALKNDPEVKNKISNMLGLNRYQNEVNEGLNLLEELNNELNAYSIHHDKLKKMAEDRKPSALVLRDRVGSENETNFKKDLQHSGVKQVIDVEKELMYKDQQTDVGKDPQKLGQDIEKQALKVTDAKSGEALKNVGDSANDEGDEIPKRNLTTAEQDEVDLYRKGMHSWVYDNEPGKRFEDRMKADMGEKIMDMRDKQLADIGKNPMYNKDSQPVDDGIDKVQFDKEKSGWNERKGIEESMITGRYRDILNKRRLIDFTLDEVRGITVEKLDESFSELDFTGLGNTYVSKSIDNKVVVNEGMGRILETYKFYTDGKNVVAVKNPVQNLNENEQKAEKPVMNEQAEKMKHLLNYKPNNFVNTANVKKNRGF